MEAKPFASLTSGLLARKGQAKPAMRPQGFGGFGLGSSSREDLGWNDMGYDVPRPATVAEPLSEQVAAPVSSPPPVILQREELAQELGRAPEQAETTPPAAPAKATLATAPRGKVQKRAPVDLGTHHRKAAFTLRLDADRHLRLRLATAVRSRSAQQLVTEALDRYLADIPELDDLAGCVPARGNA